MTIPGGDTFVFQYDSLPDLSAELVRLAGQKENGFTWDAAAMVSYEAGRKQTQEPPNAD